LVKLDDIVEIGELATRHELQRKDNDDERLTIFDSSGVAIQDCVIAMMVNDALCKDDSKKMVYKVEYKVYLLYLQDYTKRIEFVSLSTSPFDKIRSRSKKQ